MSYLIRRRLSSEIPRPEVALFCLVIPLVQVSDQRAICTCMTLTPVVHPMLGNDERLHLGTGLSFFLSRARKNKLKDCEEVRQRPQPCKDASSGIRHLTVGSVRRGITPVCRSQFLTHRGPGPQIQACPCTVHRPQHHMPGLDSASG